jgi:hypothetical protein
LKYTLPVYYLQTKGLAASRKSAIPGGGVKFGYESVVFIPMVFKIFYTTRIRERVHGRRVYESVVLVRKIHSRFKKLIELRYELKKKK